MSIAIREPLGTLALFEKKESIDAKMSDQSTNLHSHSTMIRTMQEGIEILRRLISELQITIESSERNIRSIERVVSLKRDRLRSYQSLSEEYRRTYDRIASILSILESVYPEQYMKSEIIHRKGHVSIALCK
jgi:chromosome segregation ATPase